MAVCSFCSKRMAFRLGEKKSLRGLPVGVFREALLLHPTLWIFAATSLQVAAQSSAYRVKTT